MDSYSLGIITTALPSPREKLKAVAALGLTHIQLQYSTENDTPERRAELMAASSEYGVDINTVFCGFAGESYDSIPIVRETVGLVPRATRDERVAQTFEIARFAREIKVTRIAAHIGFIPHDDAQTNAELVATVQEICDHLAPHGQNFSLETGQETAATLLQFLKDVGRPNLQVNFDPANMILYGNDEPIGATRLLAPWIDGIHCKDGSRPVAQGQLGEEKPFGHGDINAKKWLQTLQELGYHGPITIEREIDGPQQWRDIAAAKAVIDDAFAESSKAN